MSSFRVHNTNTVQIPKVIPVDGIIFNNNAFATYPPVSYQNLLYLENGIFKYKSPSNTITIVAT